MGMSELGIESVLVLYDVLLFCMDLQKFTVN